MSRIRARLAFLIAAVLCGIVSLSLPAAAAPQCSGTDCVYFTQTDSVSAALVNAINAETVRIDISTWYFDDSNVYTALLNRFNAGVPVRLIGDRGSIFDADPNTRATFEYLASQGLPIRLRYNPNWYPEIDHWKAAMFVGQGLVEFGSPNFTVFELAPFSSTNYNDENALFTTDPTLFDAMESKFDKYWNDTTTEPDSMISGPPYFKNWNDACALETNCADYKTNYPNPKPMVINTARLFGDFDPPADLIFGQGEASDSFNPRLVTEINKENTAFDLVVYRLTVSDIANAILSRFQSGVAVRIMLEPNEYTNRVYPEFWLTHAYIDMLWAAGVPIMQRLHTGNTHQKTLITSTYATIASSNFMAAWQRDHDYFISAASKPAIYQAVKANFDWMWSNSNGGYSTFTPSGPDAPNLETPASGAGSTTATPTLTWDRAAFATNYDVYLWPSGASQTRVANVAAQLVPGPPSTYSWTVTSALQCNTTYDWQIVSRTNATPLNSSLVAGSPVWQFTTGATNCGGGGGGGTLPSPWTSQDVGSTGVAGSASFASGVFTVKGAGADIWSPPDAFQYVSQPVNGDQTIVARVVNEQNTSQFAKAGVMMRESISASDSYVMLDELPNGSIEFMTRTVAGAQTTFVASGAQAFPAWLKLVRSGSAVTGFASADGSTWTQIGATSTSMSTSMDIGLIVCSHDATTLNTANFDNVAVTAGGGGGGGGGTVPSPWASQDVGSTGVAGSASFASGVFTVKGAGVDIWSPPDGFQYVYQPVSGDQTIVARVVNEQNTSQYAKAGLMIRQSTSPSDAYVMLDEVPNGSIEFMTRTSSGAQTTFVASGTQAFPAWLKLVRSGSSVSGFTSADGTTWTLVGTTSTSMSPAIDIGLIVCSHNTSALNTANFDNVAVTAGGGGGGGGGTATNVVIYAGDVAAANIHGSWSLVSDGSAAGGSKLASPDLGVANTSSPLASPTDYVDVTFNAQAGTPYTLWMRLEAAGNSKFNDSLYVQFSDASTNGSSAYPIGSTSGLVVNLATDSTGSSDSNWGWVDGAYWLSQPATFTFPTTGSHTLRVQVREDGVEFDQIVLSPTTYFNAGASCPNTCGGAPGGRSNDMTIVAKP